MWNLAPWPGIKPGPPALGVQGLNHWTTREVPGHRFLDLDEEGGQELSTVYLGHPSLWPPLHSHYAPDIIDGGGKKKEHAKTYSLFLEKFVQCGDKRALPALALNVKGFGGEKGLSFFL